MAKYVIALSGGADSVCLLLRLLKRGEVGIAAHCNFGLRGEESNRDEAFVRSLCKEKGVPLEVKSFDTQAVSAASGESIEMTARRLRYEWFSALVSRYGCDGVAVGHHQEDNVETILLNMARGTGLQGLQGMQLMSENAKLLVYRPLLNYSKKQILEHLKACNQPFVTDSTNSDVNYKRNRIRHIILPEFQRLNPQFVQSINTMARHLTEAYTLYRERVDELLKACSLAPLPNYPKYWQIRFDHLLSTNQSATLLHELLAPYGFSETQVASLPTMRVGGFISSSKGIATRSEKKLIFGPPVEPIEQRELSVPKKVGEIRTVRFNHFSIEMKLLNSRDIVSLRCEKNELFIDLAVIVGPLKVRGIVEADRFHPFGMKGSRLLSDYLTDRHFSRIEKALTGLVCDDKGIVWVMGERGDERFRITEQTALVLRLRLQSN